MRIPSNQLSSNEFLQLYTATGTAGDFWEYKGVKNGCHWLYHYGFKQPQQSVVSLMEKSFVNVNEMPKDFPSVPQPKPVSINTNAAKAGIEHWLKQ